MPLVRISIHRGKPAAWREAVGAGIHRAMVETLAGVPADDFFQIIQHKADGSLLIVAGDVSGKGLQAGMLVAR